MFTIRFLFKHIFITLYGYTIIVRKNKTIFFFITFSSGLQPLFMQSFFCIKLRREEKRNPRWKTGKHKESQYERDPHCIDGLYSWHLFSRSLPPSCKSKCYHDTHKKNENVYKNKRTSDHTCICIK